MTHSKMVDELGKLKAKISKLTAKEKVLKERIKKTGKDSIDGELFRATMSWVDSQKFDSKTFKEVKPALFEKFSYVSSYMKLDVKARIRDAA